MKRQTTTKRALAIRKTTAARKRQKGFAMEWIIIVLLIAAALVPLMLYLSNVAQRNGWTIGKLFSSNSLDEANTATNEHTGTYKPANEVDRGKAEKSGQDLTNFGGQ